MPLTTDFEQTKDEGREAPHLCQNSSLILPSAVDVMLSIRWFGIAP